LSWIVILNPSSLIACSTGTTCSSGKVAGLLVFEVFSFLWTSQVIGNVALATMAGGAYGSKPHLSFYGMTIQLLDIILGWYYFGPRHQGQMVGTFLSSVWPNTYNHQPKHPTATAFLRASTLSLGSIAFGSLIVTLLELTKLILNAAQNYANADGHREQDRCHHFLQSNHVISYRGVPGVLRCLLHWLYRKSGAVLQQVLVSSYSVLLVN
jgi:hypothetical protein